MIFIDSNTVENAAVYNEWVDCMESAFLEEAGKDYIMPVRTHINFKENTLLLMPCIKDSYFATKLVSLFPGNAGIGKQPLFGLVVLNDGATGEPLAIIDGAKLTAMRTAAVGSVAIRHLSPPDVSSLGIIGMGIQGIHQALFACSQRKISTIHILDATPGTYKRFIDTLNKEYPGIEIIIADNSTHLCHESEVIITATNSKVPVIPSDKNSILNKTIIGVGSYKPDMREFPDEVYPLAGTIYIDTLHGLKESGDLLYPIENKILGEDKFISIERAIREPVERRSTNVFKSVGMALFDLFGAVLIYEKQQKSAG